MNDFDRIRQALRPEQEEALQAVDRLEKSIKDFSGCFRDMPAGPLVDKARKIIKGENI